MRERFIGAVKYMTRSRADDRGTSAIEYAVIAAGISIAIVTAVNGVGSSVNTLLTLVQGIF